MTKEHSKKEVMAAWQKWAAGQPIKRRANYDQARDFFTHLESHRSELVHPKCKYVDWQTVHGWLRAAGLSE
jgi:hypothetical protein